MAPSITAQVASSEVHIIPRSKSTATPAGDIDPASLRNRTKPLVKDVELVLVPVTVIDDTYRAVAGLQKENFELYEGKDRQLIRNFSSEDAPISIGIIMDLSGSMQDKIERSRDAVVEFLRAANPQDEFFLVTFAEKPELISEFTDKVEEIQSKMLYMRPKGRTAMFDAIYLGMQMMSKAKHQRKAMLVVSDGGDNHSRYTETELRSILREGDVTIYGLGIYGGASSAEEQDGPGILKHISEMSGGRMYEMGDSPGVARNIGDELRTQYVLSYSSSNNTRDGKWRKIKVKLRLPNGSPRMSPAAKKGYYAPEQQ